MEKVDCYFIGQIARVQRTFTEDDVKRWSLLTQDFNDVYDPEFFSKDFGRSLVPGILSEGLLTEAISKELPGGPCVIIQKELVFIHPVQIDSTITAEIEIIDVNVQRNWITIKVRCRNELRIDVIQGKIILKLL
ncbi:hotdog family protein [Peribacillus butanolivorans]|uniref:hypothetical protein n=1 Tax=Peribacillus butanolivorans TaxID=421767 RepID=UPI0036508477